MVKEEKSFRTSSNNYVNRHRDDGANINLGFSIRPPEQCNVLSLVQQISQLEDVAPVGKSTLHVFCSKLTHTDGDPEDVHVTGIDQDPDPDPSIVADNSAARAHYFDIQNTTALKHRESLILDESDDSESDSASEDAESGSQASEVHLETGAIDHETGMNCTVDTHTTTDTSTERPSPAKQHSDVSSTLHKLEKKTVRRVEPYRDRLQVNLFWRGVLIYISCVQTLWDSLLDARIRLQRSVAAGNRLTHASSYSLLSGNRLTDESAVPNYRQGATAYSSCENRLLSANESIQPPSRKRRRSTENDYSVADYAGELREASHVASELERAYHPHLVQTLNKWSSKIQAVAPSVLLPPNRNAFSRTTQHIKPAPQLVDETLADHSKVLTRTRIYRGKGSRVGISPTDEDGTREMEDPEVFDDTDFYHQLLRDIIDARGSGTGGNDDWTAVQKEKKARKKVDTKASKGRKLRYEIHEKIQNFMVPVSTQGSWHEEQVDELFASLLGKGFESAMQEAGETVDESLQEEGNAALMQGGFRVFG
ncbi:TRAUB-domain-containing protein [Boletus reticuloceps]|uniref:Protein BFR2 n=1 Tax=Boletus reticuloceps TaxID=495285 RepID=A0A8I2Z138_9AGAM|nr:TRAUB-domain-containing protein [Boletus reticuloceps]